MTSPPVIPGEGVLVLRKYTIGRQKIIDLGVISEEESHQISMGIGSFLQSPLTTKNYEAGQFEGLFYGVSSMQGWRAKMEDAHSVQLGLGQNMDDWGFFAVFDGHSGHSVANFAAKNLLAAISETQQFQMAQQLLSKKEWKNGSRQTVAGDDLRALVDSLVKTAITNGFLKLDVDMRMLCGTDDRAGSTAVCVIVSPEKFYFANLGDSRGLLCRNGMFFWATEDHKPFCNKERQRILKAGGNVLVQRVNGSLAVSRALGDYEYKADPYLDVKDQLVTPEPDVDVILRNPLKDNFLLLGCDGIFDVMKNHDVADFVLSLQTDNAVDICAQLIDSCLDKGSRDNMTVLLIKLPEPMEINSHARPRSSSVKI